jgi:hypothetical protein
MSVLCCLLGFYVYATQDLIGSILIPLEEGIIAERKTRIEAQAKVEEQVRPKADLFMQPRTNYLTLHTRLNFQSPLVSTARDKTIGSSGGRVQASYHSHTPHLKKHHR